MELSLSSFSLLLLLLINTKPSSPTQTSSFTTDQNALAAFKNTITPDNILTHNWSSNTPTCRWTGVSCGPKHRRVTSLNLSSFGLAGTITPHLGNLTFLRSLDISHNNFTGSLPTELSNLRRLKEMDVGFNNFGGEVPSWFGALSRLQHLRIPNNTFSGRIPESVLNISGLRTLDAANNILEGKLPEGLFGMLSLMEIDVRFNRISDKLPSDMCNNSSELRSIILSGNRFYGEIPASIYRCREMEELRFRENQFSGNIPSEIGRMLKLRTVSVHSNRLQGSIPSFIFNISSLRILSLSKNNFSGSFPTDSPYNLPNIEEMYFSDNNLTGGIPKDFGNLTTLKTLELQSNIFTGELPHELGNLTYLEIFKAPYNNLSGSIPSSIFNISTLTQLYLQQNLFSGSLPSNLGLSIGSLQIFILHFNRLTGNIPSSIANATKLTALELNRNFFTGSIPNFGNLRQLEALRLWENDLTGAESPTQEISFLTSLTNCRNLKFLEISSNRLDGILPSSIGNLSTFLISFYASSCNINGGIPSEIGNLTSLQALYLSGNQITGSIPGELGKLKQLVELYLGINRLQGYVPHELCQMSNLEDLDLSYNMLTGALHECLGEVKTLRTISFSSNKLNSTIPFGFWDLSDLISLDLSSNYLSGELSSRIGSWKIGALNLSFNQFSGGIPSSIEGCLSLEYLSLSNNKFGGAIPESLGKVRVLATLDLSNNSLSGSIPMSLADLQVLVNFNVSYNYLEGEIPDGGCFENFNATSFVHNSDLCGAARFQVRRCVKDHGRSTIGLIVKYIIPSFISTIILVVVVVMLIRRRKQKNAPPPVEDPLRKIAWRRISYIDLVQGTSSFSEMNLLGRGSFGSVFKATLSDGLTIAVKVFNLELEGAVKSFDTESKILSSIRHRNLLPIIGCCINTEFRALILAYMPNGSLEKWLHSDSYCLDLMQRLEIAIDVALALEYLHHGHTFPVVHCDIKPSNILLDEDITARVGDFGISKLFEEGEAMVHTKTLATIGYAAPEYGSEGKVSTNGDVYSYGILLLEMFTGKKPTDDMFDEETSIVGWVSGALQENAMGQVVAPGLLSAEEDQHVTEHEHCVSSIFDLALKCLVSCPDERTDMVHVAAALHRIRAKVTAAAADQAANVRRRR